VWQKAHELTLAAHRVKRDFPRDEVYGLTAQLRRSSSSIPANLAERCGRGGDTELSGLCWIAMGSASDLEYHLLLVSDLVLIKAADYATPGERLDEVKAMLSVLLKKLEAAR
jgi:four helix bundle protein